MRPHHKFPLYVVLGAFGTAVHYSILYFLVRHRFTDAVTASSIGAIAGAVVNYLLNHRYTFKSSVNHIRAAPKFFIVAGIGFFLNWIAMISLVNGIRINYMIAQVITTALVLFITYTLNAMWSFKHTPPKDKKVFMEGKITGEAVVSYTIYVVLCTITFLLGILVVSVYAGLIPIGHWHDEFYALHKINEGGFNYLLSQRLLWSPRPFSEPLIFFYAHLVKATQSPLIGSSLATLWISLTVCFFAIPVLSGKRLGYTTTSLCLLISLCSLCLFLLGHPVSEMFYWPMAAMAYLPAAAGIWVASWIMISGSVEKLSYRIVGSIMLTISATSAEVGALVVLIFAGLSFLYAGYTRFKLSTPTQALTLWLLVPLLVSLWVLYAIKSGRLTTSAETMGDPKVVHNLASALFLSVTSYLRDVLSVDGIGADKRSLILGIATKATFFAGAVGVFWSFCPEHRERIPRQQLGIMSISCFITAFLIIVASYYQFGLLCCERHITFRQVLVFIGLLTGAGYCVLMLSWRVTPLSDERVKILSVTLLFSSILIPATVSVPALLSEYKHYHAYLSIKVANWNAGLAPQDSMIYQYRKGGPIVGGIVPVADGTYTLENKPGWWMEGLMSFFQKKSVTIVPVKD